MPASTRFTRVPSPANGVARNVAGFGGVSYSTVIGRVGALAVALGVGAGFTVGMPALAWAGDTESSSSPESSSSSDPSPNSTSQQEQQRPDTGPSAEPTSSDTANAEPEQSYDDVDKRKASDDDVEQPSDDTVRESDTVDPPTIEEQAPTIPSPSVATDPPAESAPTDDDPPAQTSIEPPSTVRQGVSLADEESAATSTNVTPPADGAMSGAVVTAPPDGTVDLSPSDVVAETLSAAASRADSPEADPVSVQALSPSPDRGIPAVATTAVSIVTNLVAAVLSPVVAPNPGTPAQPPLLFYAVLDWLRREVQRTFFNRSPHAVANSYTTSEGQDVSGNVLTDDTDADGDVLRASLISGPGHGDLTLNRDGTFVYTPTANYSGTDTFTYKVTDAGFHLHGLFGFLRPDHGHSDTATVTLMVNPVDPDNNMPVTMGDNYAVTAGETLTVAGPGVLANDNDPDGDPLAAVKFSDPAHGSVTLNTDGSFTYVSNADFLGIDQFQYYADDGTTSGNPAFVSITVTAEAAPVAGYDSYATAIGTSVTIGADALLDNDFDNENDPLTVIVTQAPENGDLVDNGDGTYTYTPDDGFIGTDAFRYVAADASGQSAPAIVSINVGVPANESPEAVADHLTTRIDTPRVITPADLVGNDTDPDGDGLTPYVVSDPIYGTLTLDLGGTYTYAPDPGFEGYDTFYYTAFDGQADSTPTAVLVLVTGQSNGNTPPVAGYDSLGTDIDTPLTIDPDALLVNDFDADGDPLAVVVTQQPANGTLSTDVTGNLVYTPDAGFTGTDSFFYSATQPENASLPAEVTISVGGPANIAPAATPDNLITAVDTPLTITTEDLVGNDSDPEGAALTVYVVSAPADGSLVDNDDGTFTYTPDTGFVGTVSFAYTAFDGQADSTPTLVTIEVGGLGPNTPPIAYDDYLSTPLNTALTLTPADIFGNDVDPDGDSSQLGGSILTLPSHGVFSTDGSAVYTPDAGFQGVDSFTYQADDGRDVSNVATVYITVGQPG